MSRVFRLLLVLTVTFALVASAAAWRQCTGLQLVAAAGAEQAHSQRHHAQNAGHGEHDHHAMHHQNVADESAPSSTPAADDHGCLKCCAMCTVANALPSVANTNAAFALSEHVFSRDREALSGSTVAVDPGIPKHIV
jgi:hypothetical protein